MSGAPWAADPDWYDLHDAAHTAGVERDAEHFQELLLALPPLGPQDHLLDAGAGTGKAALLAAAAYPELGQLTLLEPNVPMLERACARSRELLPDALIQALAHELGHGAPPPTAGVTVALAANLLLPGLEAQGGSLGQARDWLRAALGELGGCLRRGGWLFLLETVDPTWTAGADEDPVRRLTLPQLEEDLRAAGLGAPEVVYRFRDRVVLASRTRLRAARSPGASARRSPRPRARRA